MSTADVARQFVIHVGVDDELLARFEDDARSRGMSVIDLDLTGLLDRPALVDYLAGTFMFPHEARELDAAVDLISDLEWFGNAGGYLVAARGLAAPSAVSAPRTVPTSSQDLRAECERARLVPAGARRRLRVGRV